MQDAQLVWKVQPQLADAAGGRLSICLDLTQKLYVIIMIKVPVCGTVRQTGRLTVRWLSGKTPTLKHISISRRTDGRIPQTKPHLQLPAAAGYLVCALWSYSFSLSLSPTYSLCYIPLAVICLRYRVKVRPSWLCIRLLLSI